MSPTQVGTLMSVLALVATAMTAFFIYQQVRQMKRQTELQRRIREDASQPYVRADVQINKDNGETLSFIVGNSGSVVATKVRISIDPPIRGRGADSHFIEVMHDRLGRGIASITPGARHAWDLGPSVELVTELDSDPHIVTIECDGPLGKAPTVKYTIDFANFRETIADHQGTLAQVAKAIEKLGKAGR